MNALTIFWHYWLMPPVGRAFFFAERMLCHVPGFESAYAQASQGWCSRLDQRTARYRNLSDHEEPRDR